MLWRAWVIMKPLETHKCTTDRNTIKLKKIHLDFKLSMLKTSNRIGTWETCLIWQLNLGIIDALLLRFILTVYRPMYYPCAFYIKPPWFTCSVTPLSDNWARTMPCLSTEYYWFTHLPSDQLLKTHSSMFQSTSWLATGKHLGPLYERMTLDICQEGGVCLVGFLAWQSKRNIWWGSLATGLLSTKRLF